jgi:hypothetical protein
MGFTLLCSPVRLHGMLPPESSATFVMPEIVAATHLVS